MALAALLVANSHLEHFYAHSWLAGDGLLGNSLFFFLAGYGLSRSSQQQHRAFPTWFIRRIARLYPAVILTILVFGCVIAQDFREWHGVRDAFGDLIWPTRFTFVAMVVPFYCLFYPLLRVQSKRVLTIGIIVLWTIYLVAYIPDVLRLPAHEPLHLASRPLVVHASSYFAVMLLGAWRGRGEFREKNITTALVLATSLFGLYVGLKYLMVTGHWARAYIVLHVLTFFVCLAFFESLTSRSLTGHLQRIRPLWATVSFIGALTLEIYVVHTFIAEYQWVWSQPEPLNLALFWALTLPLAYLVGRVVRPVQSRLQRAGEAGTAVNQGAKASIVQA